MDKYKLEVNEIDLTITLHAMGGGTRGYTQVCVLGPQ